MKAVLVLAIVAAAAATPSSTYGRGGGVTVGVSGGRGSGGYGSNVHGGFGGSRVSSGYGGGVQSGHGGSVHGGYGGGSVQGSRGGSVHGGYGGGSVQSGHGGSVHGGYGNNNDYLVDLSHGYSDYHFSWRHDGGKKYDGQAANYYCKSLGYGWQGVSIETQEEDAIISNIIYQDKVKYIWTSGVKSGYSFVWASGNPFYGLNWSYTGSLGKPQPDNAEDGKEYCLAVLNNFYKDGIKWHDVACHHEKPIICERPRTSGSRSSSVVSSGGYGGAPHWTS